MRMQEQAGAPGLPDMKVSVRQVFGIDSDLEVPAYSSPNEHVPDLDPDYLFNREVTLAILAGFKHNRRVMIRLSRRKIDSSKSGRGSAALAVRSRQPRRHVTGRSRWT